VEIRESKTGEELLSLQRHGVARADRKSNIAQVCALELRRLVRFYIVDGFGEPRLQFIEGFFGVGRGRHLAVGEARATLGGEIGRQLDLLAERQHIRIKPRAEQHLGRNVLRLAVRFGLGEDAGKAAENLQEGGDGDVIEGHGCSFLCCSLAPHFAGRGLEGDYPRSWYQLKDTCPTAPP